jgi:hypothetical protein
LEDFLELFPLTLEAPEYLPRTHYISLHFISAGEAQGTSTTKSTHQREESSTQQQAATGSA